ncbi:serine/threonine-protein kinase [Haloechinothrix salitolerans]|uniref:non-specific serine/threonine protein kinase n=1 Tax=Haloechinothrix salitolerans TaxID=926830 RepID=A0ABW2C7F6_9PSEU
MTTEGRLLGDRYRLSQPIGRGRGGFIWIAQDQRVHRTVAAKPVALPQGGTATDTELEIAVQRARDAARLKHQCAVTVYDVLVEGDGIWLIMEYVPSRTMADFLAGHGKLAAQDTVTLGAQLAAALAAAAELGITHRAVEPANVLLADDGGVQITDFGVGALHHDPAFRAPEVIAGGTATAASDVFSLGATLYFAVRGATPFGPLGTDPGPDLGSAAHADTTAPTDAATLLPRLLADMLATNPMERPSMGSCWEALTAIAEGRQPTPRAVPPQPHQSSVNEAESSAAATAAPRQGTASPPAQPHPTTPIRTRPAPPPAPAPQPIAATSSVAAQHTPDWHHQPMPPMMNAAGTGHPGDAARATTPASQNRTAMRALLAIAVLAAAMVGILFTELLLV